jgi:hypothetical protein
MQEEQEIRERYRQVFTNGTGPEVLTYMLTDLGFFDEAHGEGQFALHNYAIRILELLGILHEQNAEEITRKILQVKPYDIKMQKETIEKTTEKEYIDE